MEKLFKNLFSKELTILVDNMDSVEMVRDIMAMKDPDMEAVAKIAWYEVEEAGLLEVVVGERGGKRRLEGDFSSSRSMQLVSPAWRTVLGYFDGKLDNLEVLVNFCKVLGVILAQVVKKQFKSELEILDISTMTQATESLVNLLCKNDATVATVAAVDLIL